MFSDLFHISRQGDLLQLSIRSSENRSDAFLLSRGDIEPAIDDDPTDSEWSGTRRFSIKRTPRNGFIRIGERETYIVFKVSRHQVEVLNAQLKAEIPSMPNTIETPFAVREESPVSAPTSALIGYNDLIAEIRTAIREELRKIPIQQSQTIERPPIQPVAMAPSSTFIPSNLADGLEGQVQASTQKSDGKSALSASKKLKELKK